MEEMDIKEKDVKKFMSIVLIIFLTAIFVIWLSPDDYYRKVCLKLNNGNEIRLLLVNNDIARVKGLGGMKDLPDNVGMLFEFDRPGKYGFWMKDMKFPIDIIWTDANYKVIHIEPNISPESFPKIFYPSKPSSFVVETNANFSRLNGIKEGNVLNISSNCD